MRKICVTILLALILTGCAPSHTVIPDPAKAHRLSRKVKAFIWVRRADGKLQEVRAEIPAGHLVVPPSFAKPSRPNTGP